MIPLLQEQIFLSLATRAKKLQFPQINLPTFSTHRHSFHSHPLSFREISIRNARRISRLREKKEREAWNLIHKETNASHMKSYQVYEDQLAKAVQSLREQVNIHAKQLNYSYSLSKEVSNRMIEQKRLKSFSILSNVETDLVSLLENLSRLKPRSKKSKERVQTLVSLATRLQEVIINKKKNMC